MRRSYFCSLDISFLSKRSIICDKGYIPNLKKSTLPMFGRWSMFTIVRYDQRTLLALSLFFILNAMDAVLTLFGMHLGVFAEANPLMSTLIYHSAVGFIVFKIAMSIIFVLFFWSIRYQYRNLVDVAIRISLTAYLAVNLLHLYWLALYYS